MTKPQKEEAQKWTIVGLLVAYFMMAAIIVALYYLNRDVSREQAARAAEQKAGAVSSLDNCYRMVDNNPDLIAIIDAVALTAQNSIASSRAALEIDPDGALAPVRRASIRRNQKAKAAALKFKRQILRTTPTEERCGELAVRLGLQPRPKEGK